MGEDSIDLKNAAENHFKFDRVFIVHGHDGALKESVARIIEKQKIEAVILSEQANRGRTIIEKFENYSDVSGAICLFTADDIGRAKKNRQTILAQDKMSCWKQAILWVSLVETMLSFWQMME